MTPSFSRSRSPSHIHLALALHSTEDLRRHPAPSSALPLSRLRTILIVSLFTLVHFAFPLTSSSHAIPSPHRSPISAHFYYLHSSAPHPSLRTAVQLRPSHAPAILLIPACCSGPSPPRASRPILSMIHCKGAPPVSLVLHVSPQRNVPTLYSMCPELRICVDPHNLLHYARIVLLPARVPTRTHTSPLRYIPPALSLQRCRPVLASSTICTYLPPLYLV
ncbi:hypothetical protein GSI_12798 [Ganoderma sinense ZZ0214-1]|uniref:Uncharacterized protein n=1 Tax=Ganoderma sinense ZZ0214-1 TaxID=1077348 RepID=A0A2G8RTS3_9APHY|nr:hypothetical protein GSI_12798 [Ganoderma sinense ZZ0214-1]